MDESKRTRGSDIGCAPKTDLKADPKTNLDTGLETGLDTVLEIGLKTFQDVSFADVLRAGKAHYRVIHRKRTVINALKALMVLCVVSAVLLALWLPVNQYFNSREQEKEAVAAMNRVKKWPQGRVAQEYEAAQRYNAGIAAGRQSFGEYANSFASNSAGKKDSNTIVTRSQRDTTYQDLLNEGGE